MDCCDICGRALNNPHDPLSQDCGGDCLLCMAECGDPDCIEAVLALGPYCNLWRNGKGVSLREGCDRCGWRIGGPDSYTGTACKCGYQAGKIIERWCSGWQHWGYNTMSPGRPTKGTQ